MLERDDERAGIVETAIGRLCIEEEVEQHHIAMIRVAIDML